jgi:hypothetical protein
MVGDGLGIGRPHADVDHGDAGAVGRTRCQAGIWGSRPLGVAGSTNAGITRLDTLDRARHQGPAQAHEFVDVELVVGEQHEVLEGLGRRAGVVAQPMQRVVDPWRGEQRQRRGLAARRFVGAVGDAVVHFGQIGQVEEIAQALLAGGIERGFDVLGSR